MNRVVLLSLLFGASPAFADEVPVPAEPAPAEPVAAPATITPAPVMQPVPPPRPEPTSTCPGEGHHYFGCWSPARLALDVDLVTQARYIGQPGQDLSDFRLDRGELGARVGLGAHAAAELRLEAVRSAVEGGALGVDGDSTVIRVRYANVAGELTRGKLTIGGALGFVQDPWIRTLEEGYTLRPLSRTGSERLLGWSPSDLSALVRVAYGPARVSVAVGNGEGLRFPERNTGKTTTAVAELAVLDAHPARLVVAGVVRDGSIGVASVRERRAGAGATVITPVVRAGFEAVHAWGLGDRGEVTGTELTGWAEARIVDHAFINARGATLGIEGGRRSTFGGALAVEPWSDSRRGRFRVWLAVERITTSGDAMPVPGADPGDATIAMLIASATAPFTLD